MTKTLENSINSLANTIAFLKKSFFVCCYIGGAYAFFVLMAPQLFGYKEVVSSQAQAEQTKEPRPIKKSSEKAQHELAIDQSLKRVEKMTSPESWRETASSDRVKKLYQQAQNPNTIKERIDALFPKMATPTITPLGSKKSGLYEVEVNGQVFLMSKDGNYIINHSYVDVSDLRSGSDTDQLKKVKLINFYSKQSAAAATPSHAGATPAQAPDSHDKEGFIDSVAGFSDFAKIGITYQTPVAEKKGEIIVFSDFTCPYCKRFHPNYDRILDAGWTIHTVPMSRKGASGRVFEQSNALYCMENQSAKRIYNTLITGGSLSSEQAPDIDTACLNNNYAKIAYDTLLRKGNGRGFTPAIWVEGQPSLMKANIFLSSKL